MPEAGRDTSSGTLGHKQYVNFFPHAHTMNHEISIGGLKLSFEPLKYSFPTSPKLRDPIAITATIKTPFSEVSAERLCIPFSDLISFRNRIKKFLRREDDGIVSLSVLMPSLDITFISRTGERVMADIRISPDLRLERHMFDFELTWNEVALIGSDFDLLLISLPLNEKA